MLSVQIQFLIMFLTIHLYIIWHQIQLENGILNMYAESSKLYTAYQGSSQQGTALAWRDCWPQGEEKPLVLGAACCGVTSDPYRPSTTWGTHSTARHWTSTTHPMPPPPHSLLSAPTAGGQPSWALETWQAPGWDEQQPHPHGVLLGVICNW